MSNTAQLRQKARSLEQREQWKPALEVYEQMTSSQPEGEDLDVGIWNRIGDLHMRLAQSDQAVSAYERAVQAYADAGLHNNALALCNKILRLTPGRPAIYLKLALISALKGFLADARQHLTHYLERLNAAGQLEIGLQTLVASADAHPEDAAEVRRVVAEQLQAHQQTGDALRLFRSAHRVLVERGHAVEAERVLSQIQECEARWIGEQAAGGAATAASPVAPAPEAEPATELDLELEIVSGEEPASPPPPPAGPAASDLQSLVLDPPESSPDFELRGISALEGFESTALDVDEASETPSPVAAEGLEQAPSFAVDAAADPAHGLGDSLAPVNFGETAETETDALPLLSFDSHHHTRDELESDLNLVAAADGLLSAWDDDADANGDSLAQDGVDPDRMNEAPGSEESFHDAEADFDLGFSVDTPAEPLPFLDSGTETTADGMSGFAADSEQWEAGGESQDALHSPDALDFDEQAEPLPFLDRPDDGDPSQPADGLAIGDSEGSSPESGLSTEPGESKAFGSGWPEETSPDAALPELGDWAATAADSEWDSAEEADPSGELPAEELGHPGDLSGHAADSFANGDLPGQAPAGHLVFEAGVEDSANTPAAEPLPSFLTSDEPVAGRPQADVRTESARSVAEEYVDLEILRAQVAAAPNGGAIEQLRTRLRQVGMDDESSRVLETAVQSLSAQGLYAEGVAALRVLLELTAADTALYQRQVELAFRADHSDLLIRSYLDLAAHLQADGEPAMVRAVYERVLELDADNEQARRALGFPEAPVAKAHADGEYVDLAALIMEDDEQPSTTRFVVEADEPSGDEDKDFAEILARFREQVAQNIDANDSASHYDLGVAFKEMGLFDEAISEFQTAIRAGANPLATLEMLGECFVAQEQYAVGWRVLDRAVRVSAAADAELVGVVYWMGRCDEALGRGDAAAECYERVLSVDIRFRDTAERLRVLRGSSSISL